MSISGGCPSPIVPQARASLAGVGEFDRRGEPTWQRAGRLCRRDIKRSYSPDASAISNRMSRRCRECSTFGMEMLTSVDIR